MAIFREASTLDAPVAPSIVPGPPTDSQVVAPPVSQVSSTSAQVASASSAGQGVAFDELSRIQLASGALPIVSADPVEPKEGAFWVRSDLNEFRWREGSVTYKVVGTAV